MARVRVPRGPFRFFVTFNFQLNYRFLKSFRGSVRVSRANVTV